jgi:hypothetical protein
MITRYTVYRTVNRINGKFYIGAHQTTDPDDEYLGSGTYIKRAIEKYGRRSFFKEVLYLFETAEEMWEMEEELILRHIADPLCMNLRASSRGGWDYINRTPGLNGTNHRTPDGRRKSTATFILRLQAEPELAEKFRKRASDLLKSQHQNPVFKARNSEFRKLGAVAWKGKVHSPDSRKAMSERKQGENNNLFGRRWIHHPEVEKIKAVTPDELDSYLANGWALGKRQKKAQITVSTKGWLTITNGINNRRVPPDTSIPEGWRLGRVTKKAPVV